METILLFKIVDIFFLNEQFICPINWLWREYLTTVSRWWSLHSPLQTAICAGRIVKLILIAWTLNYGFYIEKQVDLSEMLHSPIQIL